MCSLSTSVSTLGKVRAGAATRRHASLSLLTLFFLDASAVDVPAFIDPLLGCTRVPADEQLQSMRDLLMSMTDEPGTPPDPIYGIWFMNWRLYQGYEIPGDSFGEGLLAFLRPEDWDASSRTYTVGQRDFNAWTVNVNVAGTVNMVIFKSGYIRERAVTFDPDNSITAITDHGGVPLIRLIPRSFENHWRSNPINATAGTFDRVTGPDFLNKLTGGAYGHAGGAYEYTAYKLYGRDGVAFPENLKIYERFRWPGDVWKCNH
eukprot:scaffold19919_cov37-Tisochrysis_lutea.AAC.1